MARGGGRGGSRGGGRGGGRGRGGGGGGRGGSKGRSGGRGKGDTKTDSVTSKRPSGRVSGRGTTTQLSGAEEKPKKFGQLSKKEKEMMEEYGELVPQDFEEDETDRVASFRKVVRESDLDYQSDLKREREMGSEGEDENMDEDEYKLNKVSAFSKLVGILQKNSKRQDQWKKRKLEEEGIEESEGDDEMEEEEDIEEEVVSLTKAERDALIKKHGKGYLQALDGDDSEEDEEGEEDIGENGDMEDDDDQDVADADEADEDEQEIADAVNQDDDDLSSDEEVSNDPFDRHFGESATSKTLAVKIAILAERNKLKAAKPTKDLTENKRWKTTAYEDPVLKRVEQFELVLDEKANIKATEKLKKQKTLDLESLNVKHRIHTHWEDLNKDFHTTSTGSASSIPAKAFTPLQQALFEPMNSYKDVLYTNRSMANAQEVRNTYVLHALNHILKTRDRILKNSGKLQRHQQNADASAETLEFKDQGFARPKVLIVLPFKNTVVDIVESLIKLSGSTQQDNKKRFFDEFGAEEDEEENERNKERPADFLETFKGNIDDHFRVGIKFTRKTLKIYSDFYSADIILASPLGLKTVIGAEGDKKRDFDFLSSIEVVIVDQTDNMLMQNWDHLDTVFEYLNKVPSKDHGFDFSRIRTWCLNGQSEKLRQNIIISDFVAPEINALFHKYSRNVEGSLKITQPYEEGSIIDVVPLVQQNFNRIDTKSLLTSDDARFDYFINQTLPQLRRSAVSQSHTMIFIPSYFDYVRVRNYFTEQKISFAAICEYTTNANVSRARSSFFHGETPFLLYTERFHFFKRYNIRGTFHLTFYGLPEYAQFYPEMLNLLALPAESYSKSKSKAVRNTAIVEDRAMSCTALFTRYDLAKLQRIVGTERAHRMCKEQGRDLFVFT